MPATCPAMAARSPLLPSMSPDSPRTSNRVAKEYLPSTVPLPANEAMRLAVQKFQHKNMIYEANFLRRQTVDALARPPLTNDYDALGHVDQSNIR